MCEEYNVKIPQIRLKYIFQRKGTSQIKTTIISDQVLEQVNHLIYLGNIVGFDIENYNGYFECVMNSIHNCSHIYGSIYKEMWTWYSSDNEHCKNCWFLAFLDIENSMNCVKWCVMVLSRVCSVNVRGHVIILRDI